MADRRNRRRRPGGSRWQVQRERFGLSQHAPPPAFRDAEGVEGALMRIVGEFGIEEDSLGTDLLERWRDVVSGPVAQHTRPGRLNGRCLVVYVDSSVWLSELSRFGKSQLLARIQKVWGGDRIADIRLQLDPGS